MDLYSKAGGVREKNKKIKKWTGEIYTSVLKRKLKSKMARECVSEEVNKANLNEEQEADKRKAESRLFQKESNKA